MFSFNFYFIFNSLQSIKGPLLGLIFIIHGMSSSIEAISLVQGGEILL